VSKSRQASVRFVHVVPVRMTVDVHRVFPRHPAVAEEPVVVVRGVVDLSPDPTERALPIWFDADVQLYADGSAEILTFVPTYGSIQGAESVRLLAIYEHAFSRSLVDTKLSILGVRT